LQNQITAKSSATSTTSSTTTNSSATAATNSTATADWKTYTNSTYGFQLTFTDPWEGYKVTESKSDSNLTDAITFSMPYNNGANSFFVFSIIVLTPNQWSKVQNDRKINDGGDLDAGIYLTKNSQYVFNSAAMNGIPPTGINLTYTDIQNVLSTFKFTQ
jgi:hypothetical protein